jgi:signal transduction histidine kinase
VKSLYLRIWLTVVAALALFAVVSGLLLQHHLEQERVRVDAALAERMAGWGDLIQNSLPPVNAPEEVQAEALREWARRLKVPLALDDAQGRRLAASDSFLRREADGPSQRRATSFLLDDGRRLWLMRPNLARLRAAEAAVGPAPFDERRPPAPPGDSPAPEDREPVLRGMPPPFPFGIPGLPFDLPSSIGLLVLLAVLFVAVAAGAWPVVRGLTRRLEQLKRGVEAFGAGALHQRVNVAGKDEVASVAQSFNRAAERVEALVKSHQSLLANASHELRSPLARLKMAVAMMDDEPTGARLAMKKEIDTNIAELDALVEEVLLSSRLDAGAAMELNDPVDLTGVAAEEAARVSAEVEGESVSVRGSDRLLRRAVRNLLENARRYGGDDISVSVHAGPGPAGVELQVCDRGPGVPESERERIFEPFYRMSGHAEREGGVGLGLALVRQIAQSHGGQVHCEARPGGGSCFVIRLPADRLLPA